MRPASADSLGKPADSLARLGDLRLIDSETGEVRDLSVDAEALRGYRERLRQFLERVETFCRAHEIGYHRVVTDTPVEAFVVAQLRGRMLG